MTFPLLNGLFGQTLFESYIFNGKIGRYPVVFTFLVSDHFYDYNQGVLIIIRNKKESSILKG